MQVTLTVSGAEQKFRVPIAGVTFRNADGTERQDVIRRLRPGDSLRLVREPANTFDACAVAVFSQNDQQIGYLPAGDSRMANHLDGGGGAITTVIAVTGGSGLLGRLFARYRKPYGCVVEIVKTDPDWKAIKPYTDRDREIERALQAAHALEEQSPQQAIEAYRQAVRDIEALDAQGPTAAAWRRVRYPVNRLSLLLEKSKHYAAALDVIQAYESYKDIRGISPSDQKSIASRRERLLKKLSET